MSTTKSSQSQNVNPRVELIYAGDCPNVEATRKALHRPRLSRGASFRPAGQRADRGGSAPRCCAWTSASRQGCSGPLWTPGGWLTTTPPPLGIHLATVWADRAGANRSSCPRIGLPLAAPGAFGDGASAAGAAAGFAISLWHPLLRIAGFSLGLGFYRPYFPWRRAVKAETSCTAGSQQRPNGRLALWIATARVIIFAGFPDYGAPRMRASAMHDITVTNPDSPANQPAAASVGNPAKRPAKAACRSVRYTYIGYSSNIRWFAVQ